MNQQTKQQHTPGPLTVRYDDPFGEYVIRSDSAGPVAIVKREADANLYAAAPEMLEVLQNTPCYGCSRRYGDDSPDAEWERRGCVNCTAARRIIAKATPQE